MENNDAITFSVTRETLVNSIEVKGKSGYEQETFVHAPFGAEVRQWNVKDGQQIKKEMCCSSSTRRLWRMKSHRRKRPSRSSVSK